MPSAIYLKKDADYLYWKAEFTALNRDAIDCTTSSNTVPNNGPTVVFKGLSGLASSSSLVSKVWKYICDDYCTEAHIDSSLEIQKDEQTPGYVLNNQVIGKISLSAMAVAGIGVPNDFSTVDVGYVFYVDGVSQPVTTAPYAAINVDQFRHLASLTTDWQQIYPVANSHAQISDVTFEAGPPAKLAVTFDTDMDTSRYQTTGAYRQSNSYWIGARIFVIEFASYEPGGAISFAKDAFLARNGLSMANDYNYTFPVVATNPAVYINTDSTFYQEGDMLSVSLSADAGSDPDKLYSVKLGIKLADGSKLYDNGYSLSGDASAYLFRDVAIPDFGNAWYELSSLNYQFGSGLPSGTYRFAVGLFDSHNQLIASDTASIYYSGATAQSSGETQTRMAGHRLTKQAVVQHPRSGNSESNRTSTLSLILEAGSRSGFQIFKRLKPFTDEALKVDGVIQDIDDSFNQYWSWVDDDIYNGTQYAKDLFAIHLLLKMMEWVPNYGFIPDSKNLVAGAQRVMQIMTGQKRVIATLEGANAQIKLDNDCLFFNCPSYDVDVYLTPVSTCYTDRDGGAPNPEVSDMLPFATCDKRRTSPDDYPQQRVYLGRGGIDSGTISTGDRVIGLYLIEAQKASDKSIVYRGTAFIQEGGQKIPVTITAR